MLKLISEFTHRKELSMERLEVCKGCEFFRERKSKCLKCGCFLNYKTLMPTATCPLGKWVR